ncbi:MAG: YlbF family regulator [Bacilli bacterium]|nr:YlbF family regulator [Bacilli bacterium]
MNENILMKVDNIVEYLKDSEDYKRYIELKSYMEKDQDINILINDIKILQKKAVNDEYKGINVSEIDKEIERKVTILNNSIIYQEFIEVQGRLNEVFQNIKFILDKYFFDILN